MAQLLEADYRVLRHDLRGAGQSAPTHEPFTMEDHAADLQRLIAETTLLPPRLIVGAAAGAAVAVTFAARHPSELAGLVLCAPALSVTPERQRYLAERTELAAREGMRAIVDQTLEKSFPPAAIHDAARYEAYRERFLHNDPISYGLANRALAESRADLLASSVSCPCLLLAGTHDSLRPLAHVQTVAASFSDATVEEIDSAHIMSEQAPEQLVQRILHFRDDVIRRRRRQHG